MSDTLSEKQKYYQLQGLVCDELPYYAADITVKAGYGAKLKRLQNVKSGKVINLRDLVALVSYSLPKFKIPVHLLPDEHADAA
jgi:hypothetical protein